MIRYNEALEIILKSAKTKKLSLETLPLLDCVGRVCAEDIKSQETIPPFDNSSMDGFALQSEVARKVGAVNPMRFKIVGRVAAGDPPPVNPNQNGAWEIMTGAPFPEGFDAVVKIEDVLVIKDSKDEVIEIEINSPVKCRQNWRGAGEDFKIGSLVIEKGVEITPEHVLALSSLGVFEVPVFRKIKIGILSTGRELVSMKDKPVAGQIRNSTAPYLVTSLRKLNCDVVHLGTILDEPEVFHSIVKGALKENFDILITTGAVSMGKFDFVTEELKKLEVDILFHKVAIKPGKPLLFGEVRDGPAIFGFPGNPISSVVALRFFLDPYLQQLNKMKIEGPIKARLSSQAHKHSGLRCFLKAKVYSSDSELKVEILEGQMSFMVNSLLLSTAWAVLPEEPEKIPEGTLIDIYPIGRFGGCC